MPVTSRPLTHRAETVIRHATDIAGEMGHNYVGTEHILLGILREGDGIAAGVLEKFKMKAEKVQKVVEAMTIGDGVKKVRAQARKKARGK